MGPEFHDGESVSTGIQRIETWKERGRGGMMPYPDRGQSTLSVLGNTPGADATQIVPSSTSPRV